MTSLRDRIAGWLGYARRDGGSTTSAHPAQWLIDWASGGPTSAGVKVNASSALKYTPFWAAVRIISGTLVSCPFKVYQHLKTGGKEARSDHTVYWLLHDRPNEYMDAVTFLETRQAHVLCYGNAYAEIQRDGGGRPVALWPLLPDKTTRKISESGVPYYEVRLPAGGTVTIADENVLHIKGLGFDGYTGYDVVTYHREAIGYGIAVKEYGARFFANGANPGGVLEHPNHLSDPAKKFLQESWNKAHQGLSMAHRLQVLEEGMKWHDTGIDPQRAQALEVQKWTVDDCSRIFQIPPHKLGSMEFSKYNNVEQLNIDFYCTTMLYWFRKWEQEVNYKLFMARERGRLFAEILADAMLRGNIKDRYGAYGIARQWGYLSINDIRDKENMNPIGPGGDGYLDPMNMVPAGSGTPQLGPGDDPGPGRMNAINAAHRELLASQWRRVITKQVKALEKGVKDDWWAGQRDFAHNVLDDAVRAYASLRGCGPAPATVILDEIIKDSIRHDAALKEADAERLVDVLMQQIGGQNG